MTTQYDKLIADSAAANGLDPKKLRAQIQAESGFNPNAVSPKGALGLGQIMPKYWLGQHGLNTLADFKDPAKNIPAMAAIMGNHVKQYGSWEAGLVAYNAGPGKNNKNINAFKGGLFDQLPDETRKYLEKQGYNAGNISTQPKGVVGLSGDRVDLNTPVQVQGTALSAFRNTTPPPVGALGSFLPGLRASAIGTALRRTDGPIASLAGGATPLSEETINKLSGAGIGASGVKFVMRNAQNDQQVAELIELARQNQQSAGTNRTLMGDLSYGLGEMLGDPITYGSLLIPGGGVAKAGQLYSSGLARAAAAGTAVAVEGAASNLVSESIREGTTGTEADYASAMAAGAAFGLGLHSIGRAAGWATDKMKASGERTIHRTEATETVREMRRKGYEVDNPVVFTPMDIDLETGIKWRTKTMASAVDEPDTLSVPVGTGRGRQVPALLRTPAGDTLHTATGIQFASNNPLNPAYSHAPAEMTAKGIPGVEIGDVLGRTQIPELQELFHNLGRASRGYTDGSSGKFGVTGQDVAQNMNGRFNLYQNLLEDARTKALQEPQWVNYAGDARMALNERVQRAIHKKDPSGLSKAEREVYQLRDDFYKDLGEQQVAPGARWGVDAPSLLDEAHFKENYGTPIIYDDLKVRQLADQIGEEELQGMVARSFIGSYLSRAEIRKAVDEAMQQLAAEGRPKADFREYANDIAFGIVKSGDPLDGVGISHLSRIMDSGVGHVDSTPGFRKMRNPFGHDFEIEIPGTNDRFSVADLFSYDTDLIDHGYFNRVRGDVSLVVGTGQDLIATSDILRNTRAVVEATNPGAKADIRAAEMLVNQLYGVGENSDWHRLRAVENITKNLAFMKSSAFMGLSNYTEIAAGIREHGIGFAARSVPGLGNILTKLQKGSKTAEAMTLAQNLVWGRELDKAILPTYSQSIQRSIDHLTEQIGHGLTSTVLGGTRGAIQRASDGWWATRVLRATTGRIVEQARSEFFADLARGAHGGKSGFANLKRAAQASVDEAQYKGMLDLLKESTKIVDGELQVTDPGALVYDPRASALRRYGQHWSQQVIQQNTASSTFRWSGLPGIGLITQFQSFVLRSVNAKLIRGTAQTLRDGDLGTGIDTFVLGPALAGLGYAGLSYLRAQKFSKEEDRKKFLEESLGKPGEYDLIAMGAFKRSAAFGAVGNGMDMLLANPTLAQWLPEEAARYGGLGRTSQEAQLRSARSGQDKKGIIAGAIESQVSQAPALKLGDSILGLAGDAVHPVVTKDENFNEEAWRKSINRHLKGLLPNDPVSQRAFNEWVQQPH